MTSRTDGRTEVDDKATERGDDMVGKIGAEGTDLRCCTLTVAVIPVRMGNRGRTKPLAQCVIPLGFIDPADARAIMRGFVDGCIGDE